MGRISVLVENTAPVPGLLGEFGFSAYLEWEGRSFLFDTGSQGSLIINARVLGIDLKDIEGVIISHGHFDHVGGLPFLLEYRGETKVYSHPRAREIKLTRTGENSYAEIGFTRPLEELMKMGAVFDFKSEPREIAPGLLLTGTVPRVYDWEDTGGPFFIRRENEVVPDPLEDDQALVLDTREGLVVVSGCAHSGVANTLAFVRTLFPGKKISAYIGGTHLISASPERLQKTLEIVEKMGVEEMVVCHCTGFTATAYLYRHLSPNRLIKGECGFTKLF